MKKFWVSFGSRRLFVLHLIVVLCRMIGLPITGIRSMGRLLALSQVKEVSLVVVG